jgi:hypothetical protein
VLSNQWRFGSEPIKAGGATSDAQCSPVTGAGGAGASGRGIGPREQVGPEQGRWLSLGDRGAGGAGWLISIEADEEPGGLGVTVT